MASNPIQTSRRGVLASLSAVTAVSLLPRFASAQTPIIDPNADYTAFPSQPRALVREIVGASHRDLEKVKHLLAAAPQLANAAIDWGFGDWETALGAASHTGRREIAAELLKHGARPDIFAAAMLGQLDVVKAMIVANPGIQSTRGPHGISLLRHARAGGEQATAVAEYLHALGDADPRYADLPLTEEQRQAYLGEYSFGTGGSDRLAIIVPKQAAQLALQGPDGAPRNLFHQGDHSFIPAGGNDVRIKFELDGKTAQTVTVHSPQHVLSARRVG